MAVEHDRPDPQELLNRLQEEEAEQARGKLKIFFGAAAGVGKTYEMLLAARKLKLDGVDVVAGYVVTHGRKETEALVEGLELLPPKQVMYKGTTIEEFDLDAALRRKPTVMLVDELAHSNAEGMRHEKRWQDVEELLEAGISVYTAMNVQHLESANDVVAQITGIAVRETVPDSVFDKAYEVVLVDLTPDELIQRLNEGKVYIAEQSKFALNNFFRKGNLIALRELALRATAERVDAQMRKYRNAEAIKEVWPVAERILVCIGPHPLSSRLVRAARRMAAGLHAHWFTVYVETPAHSNLSEKDRDRVTRTLQLAEQLGAQTATLSGPNVQEELLSYSRRQNVSKIIIGKPAKARWKEKLFGSIVDDLIRRSGNIDVYVISGDAQAASERSEVSFFAKKIAYKKYVYALLVVIASTIIARIISPHFHLVNMIMVYQLGIVFIATRWGRGPSIFSSIISTLVFDYLFVPPYFSFSVTDTQYLLTLASMLLTALTISTLTSTVRQQADLSRLRERHTSALYEMTREQASALTKEGVLQVSLRHLNEVFACKSAVFLPEGSGQLVAIKQLSFFEVDAKELGVAQWVFLNKQSAGRGTKTLPGSIGMYLPMRGAAGIVGVLGINLTPGQTPTPEEFHLLETFVSQIALTVERAILSEQLAQANSKLESL
jgi:two-component system sensor histidine kinase KdpD